MAPSVSLALAPGVVHLQDALWSDGRAVRLRDAALVRRLQDGITTRDLESLATTTPGRSVDDVLAALHRWRLLAWRLLAEDGQVLAEARPLQDDVPLPRFPDLSVAHARLGPEPDQRSVLRPVADGWVWEAGTGEWAVQLADSAVALLADRDRSLLAFAAAVGLAADEDGSRVGPDAAALATWEVHDLHFAARSRLDAGGGGTFPFAAAMPAPEPAPPYADSDALRVRLPDWSMPTPQPGFFDVLRDRRSVRSFEPGLAVEQLSSVLGATLGRTAARRRDEADPHSYTVVRAPVPSAGGMQAIETWVVASGVTGVPDGAWWYDAVRHELVRSPGDPWAGTLPYDAPVLLIHAYRHARLAWKYAAIAHALALKDAGSLMQTVHLATGAIGLGSVILGSGRTRDLCRALGIDPWEFMPVGEMVLGRPAP